MLLICYVENNIFAKQQEIRGGIREMEKINNTNLTSA